MPRMGLFGHMRIHERGIDRSPDAPGTPIMPTPAHVPQTSAPTATSSPTFSTSCTPTMLSPTTPHRLARPPSLSPKLIPTPPTSPVYTVPAHSPHVLTWSVTCDSIAQRLATPYLEHQPTLAASSSTVHIALAHSFTAWVYKATCASSKTCGRPPPAASHRHVLPHQNLTAHRSHPSKTPNRHLPLEHLVDVVGDDGRTVVCANVNVFGCHKQLRGDFIQTYRIVRGREYAPDFNELFKLAGTDRLHGHPSKLQMKLAHSDVRRDAFSQRDVGA
ncbi:hypothetical protein SprV_0401642700 [Sparganum proliferum]